jgi:hypothetical protein
MLEVVVGLDRELVNILFMYGILVIFLVFCGCCVDTQITRTVCGCVSS